MGRVDAIPSQNNKKEAAFTWTDVYERTTNSSSTLGKVAIGYYCFLYSSVCCLPISSQLGLIVSVNLTFSCYFEVWTTERCAVLTKSWLNGLLIL